MFKSTLDVSNSYLFVNAAKINQFKAKDSQIAWEIFQKDVSVNNMKGTGLNEYVHDFSVDYSI